VFLVRSPVAYHSAGSRWGTATLKFYDRRDNLGAAPNILSVPRQLGGQPTGTARVTAARRAFCLAFSITQRDVVPSAELDAGRKPCAVWLA